MSDPSSSASTAQETLSDPPSMSQDSSGVAMPDDVRLQVEREQALADAQRKVRALQEETEKLKGEKQALEGDKENALSTTNQLRTQLSALQSQYHKSNSELSVLQTRIDTIEREKKELVDETDRLQQRSNKNTQELFALRSQKAEASQKIAHLDVEVSDLRMSTETAKFNEKRSTQALQSARAEILNLSKAVTDVEERFGRYRAEKQAEQSQSRTEHETALTRLSTVENSYRSIQRTYNDQSKRLAEAHANIATLTSAAAAKKASVSLELHQLTEENRILEKRGDEARATIHEREAELERLSEAFGEKEKSWEEKWKKEERSRREAEKRADDLKVVVERLALAGGEGTDVSPAAALASGLKQSGKTYTQFYTDYTIQEGKLRAAENEVSRLTGLLDEISQDISEKKPLLDEQAAEHAHAIERANSLAAELATVIAARDANESEVKTLKAASTHHNEEVNGLQTTVDDLSRQVQVLVRQIAIHDDPSLANVNLDGDAIVSEGDIISDHLLEFRSLRSLQEQNQKLLRLTRSLMAKLDQREIRRAAATEDDEDTGATLDQATDTINRLHTQLLESQKKINEATRERDFFSNLLAKGEGLRWNSQPATNGPFDEDSNSNQQAIATLHAELDVVRNRAESEVSEAKTQVKVKNEQLGVAEVERAKAEAKVGLLEEQSRMLNEANALQKQEYNSLETQHRQLEATISRAHDEQRAALEQVAARQAEADRLRNEAALLKAEKEQWKSTESRLQSDFAQVQSERVKLQQLIDNLKNIASEAEKTRAEERTQLEKRIEDLQREATALRGQIEQAQQATRDAQKQIEDFDGRLAAATTTVRAEKEASDKLASTRAEEIKKLQEDVEKATNQSNDRLRIGNNWKRRAEALTEERAGQNEAIANKDKEIEEINKKIENLNKEVESGKNKLVETEKKLADTERTAALKENTVQRLQSELTRAQQQSQTTAVPSQAPSQVQTQPDPAALTALQSEKEALQQRLSQAEKDLEAARSALATATATASAASTSASAPVSAPTEGNEGAALTDAERTDLTTKLEQLQKDKAEYDQRYESNVTRVNRVNGQLKQRVDTLLAERKEVDAKIVELEQKIAELESAAAAAAAASNTSNTQGGEGGSGQPAQSVIDEAVRAALEDVKPDITKLPQAEIEVLVNERTATLQTEANQLRGEVEDLKTKAKALERQVKTAEISRKTLERQKAEVEKKLEARGETPAPTPAAAGLSAQAGEFKPVAVTPTPVTGGSNTTATPAAPATTAATATTPAGPAGTPTTTTGTAIRGAVRGRARGVVRGATRGAAPGRPNSVLSAVNATLAQTTSPTPAIPTAPAPGASGLATGVKRPLPEDGEITSISNVDTPAVESTSAQGGVGVPGTTGTGERGRVLKRPRGTGRGAGAGAGAGRGGRRSSAGGPGAAGGGAGAGAGGEAAGAGGA